MTRNELAMVIRARDNASGVMRAIGKEVASLNQTLNNMKASGFTATGNAAAQAGGHIHAAGNAAAQAGAHMKSAGSNAHQMAGGMGDVVTIAKGMVVAMAVMKAIDLTMQAVSTATIGFNAALEQSEIAFATLLKSGTRAKAFLADLQKFAAATPFEFPQLVDASKRLLAFGFVAHDVKPLLMSVGDAVAALGSGQDGIQRVTLALGQMRTATKVNARDMLQLTEVGIPAWQILADAMGKSTAEVQKLSENGEIASAVFIKAFQEFVGQNWGGLMEKQSRTFLGAMSTIKDSLSIVSATAMRPFFDEVSRLAVKLAQFVQTDDALNWGRRVAAGMEDAASAFGIVSERVRSALAPLAETVRASFQTAFAAGTDAARRELGNLIAEVNENLGTVLQVSVVLLGMWATIVAGTAAAAAVRFAVGVAAATVSLVAFNVQAAISATVVGALFVKAIGVGAIAMGGMVVGAVRGIGLALVILGTGLLGIKDVFLIAARAAVAAFTGTILPAVTGAIGAILVASAPFIAGIAAIATVIALVAVAWHNNWFDMRSVVGRALKWVEDRIGDFLDWMQGLPILGGAVKWVRGAASSLVAEAPKLIETGKNLAKEFAEQFAAGFPDMSETIRKATEDAKKAMADLEADVKLKLDQNEQQRQQRELAQSTAAFLESMIAPAHGAEAAIGDLGSKAKGAGLNVGDLVKSLVLLNPASQAAAASVAAVKLQLTGLESAQQANTEATRVAQEQLRGMQETVSRLGTALSDAKSKLDALSQPKLTGMGELDENVFQAEQQIKRLQLAEKGIKPAAFGPMSDAARAFVATLPDSIEGIQELIEVMRLQKSLKYDEQLREAAKAAKGVEEEMSFEDAIAAIAATKIEIGSLGEQLTVAEQAVVNQEAAIRSLEDAGRALTRQIQDMREQLRLQEERQKAVNEALEIAFRWFVDDRQKMIEMGGEAVTQAGIIDEQTRALLSTVNEWANGEAALAAAKISALVDAWKTARAQIDTLAAGVPAPGPAVPSAATDGTTSASSVGGGAWIGTPTGGLDYGRLADLIVAAFRRAPLVVYLDGQQLSTRAYGLAHSGGGMVR